ncbi:MAG: cysteine dioxygenase family protein [Rhodospirillales bacterium]
MTADYGLDEFLADARAAAGRTPEPADCVETVAPLMRRLLCGPRDFLNAGHFQADPEHYARNAVYIDAAGGPSLYALVWLPGQWTPVHDHGVWGVVGVIEGMLEERNFIRVDAGHGGGTNGGTSDSGIDLRRGGQVLLNEGSVTTFVPNPDHIHKTGVAQDRAKTVSLHLYGRTMDSFHIYDTGAGTRKRIEVSHN